MGNRYNHRQHHHLHHHNFHDRTTTFLPMLCRTSIKDVHLPKPSSNDPSSPRVSCMGQVKRNNKVTGFPTPYRLTAASTTTAATTFKYTKLKRLFSSKNLTDTRTTTTNLPVNVVELDPPLPVVKKVRPPGGGRDEVNLWKRRSSGLALKNLQIQQINGPNNQHLPPTTV